MLSASDPRGYTCVCHKGFLLDRDGANCSSGMIYILTVTVVMFEPESIFELINTGTTAPSPTIPPEHGIAL